MSFGQDIKTARQRMGMSQADLAALTGVSQPTVANWERGSHTPRSAATEKINRALGLSIDPAELSAAAENAHPAISLHRLSSQVYHVPLIDWPENAATITQTPIKQYISIGINAQRPLALPCHDKAMSGAFRPGAVVIIERTRTQLSEGEYGLYDLGDRLAIRKQGERADWLETEPRFGLPEIEVLPKSGKCIGVVVMALREF